MIRITQDSACVLVPTWVIDLQAFRRWSESSEFPQDRPVWWLKGEVWIEMSKEQIFTHILVKTKIMSRLSLLVEEKEMGLFLGDGLLLSNFAADISGNPDGTFLSTSTLHSDRVRLVEGSRGGYTEVQGSPDMVLEVVSESSVHKDTEVLRKAYWEADIPEYWIVDVRGEDILFEILRRGSRGYVSQRSREGWVRSAVFARSFRLIRRANALGHPDFTLEVR